jgi:nitroreductase
MSTAERIRLREPHGIPVSADPAEVLEHLLAGRWSCRAFEPSAVPRPVIERLLRLAQRAASWCNTQPWQVIVTTGDGTERFRAALRAHAEQARSFSADGLGAGSEPDFPMPERYEGIYRERRRESGWQLYGAVGIARGDREASALQALKNFELFGAPHAAIVTTDAGQGVYGAVDTGVYVGTFLLAAQALGLGAIPQAALARYGPFVRKHFSIPDDRKILLGISFGYPDRQHPANSYRTSRAEISEVVQWISS